VWNDGPSAECTFKYLQTASDIRLNFSLRFFVAPPKLTVQRAKVYVNGHFVEQIEGISMMPAKKSVVVTNKYLKGDSITLFFEFPDAVSPVELGMNEYDYRKLAIGLCDMNISEVS
jgi:hypothetical protein